MTNKDIQITKILLMRGESADLPQALDSAELGFTTNDGRLFLGLAQGFRGIAEGRTVFPFENLEIITENSTEVFAQLHGERIKRSGGDDYYNSVLNPNEEWSSVIVNKGELNIEYAILNIESVTAFIEYAAYLVDGTLIRMGTMSLRHFADNPAEPFLEDNGARDRSSNPLELRFNVEGQLNAPFLVFQYKSEYNQPILFRFNVTRPNPTYYQRKNSSDPVGRIVGNLRIRAQALSGTYPDSSGTILSSIDITPSIFGSGELSVFDGWYARAKISLINPTTTLEGGDLRVRPNVPEDITLSGTSSGDLFYPNGVPQRIYDPDGNGVTLYWIDPDVMTATEARLRLLFSGPVGNDMRGTFTFQRWNQGSTVFTNTRQPLTNSQVIDPNQASWTTDNPFDLRTLSQDVWYFDITI